MSSHHPHLAAPRPGCGVEFFCGMVLLALVGAGCTANLAPAAAGAGGNAPPPNGKAGSGGTGAGVGPSTTPDGGTVTGTGGGAVSSSCDALTGRRVRRLSIREYANVVSDLLGTAARASVLSSLQPENLLDGFDNQDTTLYVSASFQEGIANLAEKLATQADPATIATCTTAAGSPACLQTFIRSFTTKAYGRPLTDPEFTRINTVAAMGGDYAASVRLVVELVLQSPHLLYVSELGAVEAAPAPQQAVPLTSYEVASQLSFLLTGTRPDDKLLISAQTNGLTRPEDIRAEAERLLQTPRAPAELVRFINGWLDMAPIAEAPKDPDVFPALTPSIVTAMQQEFDQFVLTQLKGGDGTLAAFMSEQSTKIPAALAPIYGADLKGTVLDANHRRGVLSLPGLLTYHSADQHSSPIERGLFVRRQLLCQAVASPPPEALARIEAKPINPLDTKTTTRQKFAAHENDPLCSGCHMLFDPIGYGFEQMDGIGRFRTTENGMPVDSRGQLSLSDVDGPFEGPAALSTKLATSKMFETCMVNRFFQFAQSRVTNAADSCVIQDWDAKFTAGGGHIKDLVFAYVAHRTFTNRKDDR